MLQTDSSQTRTLTVVLAEADWRALREAEPDALAWLQTQIRTRLSSPVRREPTTPSSPAFATDDDY